VLEDMRLNNPEQFNQLKATDLVAIDEAVGALVTDLAKQGSTSRDDDTPETPSVVDTQASLPQSRKRKTRKTILTEGLDDIL
jgi:hypothetical protein